jgi:hypothetical protein
MAIDEAEERAAEGQDGGHVSNVPVSSDAPGTLETCPTEPDGRTWVVFETEGVDVTEHP